MTDHAPIRRPLIVANWKMNKNETESAEFVKTFIQRCPDNLERDVVICPPYPFIATVRDHLNGKPIAFGAQDVSEHKEGAYTGQVSGSMLRSLGCRHVIIGHSERRQYQNESDTLINKKAHAALQAGLSPIVCVGEKLEEREAGQTANVVTRQVMGALEDIPSSDMQKLVIAYEPVWAIGTGKTAAPTQAQEVHLKIRDILKDQYGSNTSLRVRILYGGSVKPDNMSELMDCEDIDGGLVGGASLKAEAFLALVQYSTNARAKK